jgi:hypothetical protein
MYEKFIDEVSNAPIWNSWIVSHRNGDTAIGKTFEDILHIKENNNPEADLHGVEIKAKRAYSDSSITLFTARPCYPPKATKYLINSYGYYSEDNSEKRFYSTLLYNRVTTYNDTGLSIGIDDSLNVIANDEAIVRWEYDRLKKITSKKLPAMGFVTADSRVIQDHEEFYYRELELMWGFSFDRFLKAIKNKQISIDFRAKLKNGRVRDHGTAFRISKNYLKNLYEFHDIIKGN